VQHPTGTAVHDQIGDGDSGVHAGLHNSTRNELNAR
jgi:hypothetical protein